MKKGKRGSKTTAKLLTMPIKMKKRLLKARIQQIKPTEVDHLEDQEAIEAFLQEVAAAEVVEEGREAATATNLGMKMVTMLMAQTTK